MCHIQYQAETKRALTLQVTYTSFEIHVHCTKAKQQFTVVEKSGLNTSSSEVLTGPRVCCLLLWVLSAIAFMKHGQYWVDKLPSGPFLEMYR